MKQPKKKRKNLTKMRRGTKYEDFYKELFEEVKKARQRGYLVNFNWVWVKARKIYRKQLDDVDALVRKHVITTFFYKNSMCECEHANATKNIPNKYTFGQICLMKNNKHNIINISLLSIKYSAHIHVSLL